MSRLLLGLALVALDALWVGALLRWLAAAGMPGVRPPGLLATLAIGSTAFLVARLLLGTRAPIAMVRAIALLSAVATVLVVARLTLYVWAPPSEGILALRFFRDLTRAGDPSGSARLLVITSAFLWWRGSRYGLVRIRPSHTKRAVGLAVIALALVAVAVSISHPVDLAPWLLGAAIASMVALALSRLVEAASSFGGTRFRIGPIWLSALAMAVLSVGVLAALLTPVLSVESADAVMKVINPLPEVLYRLFALAVMYFAKLIFSALETVRDWLYMLAGEPDSAFRPQSPPIAQEEVLPWRFEGSGAPKWVVDLVRLGVFAIGMVLVFWWLGRTLRRFEDREVGGGAAERESELSLGRIRDDLAATLHSAAMRAAAAARRYRTRPTGVRALYSQLLQLVAEMGVTRRPAQTPYEFEPWIAQLLPAVAVDISALTGAYVRVRYGDRHPDDVALAELSEAWHRIRQAGERTLDEV